MMGYIGRPGWSAAQKADLWQRWKQGQSLSEIGRALGKYPGSIHGVLSSKGGVVPPVHTVVLGSDAGRARRDFAWPRHGALDSADRGHARSSTVEHQLRNPPPWWRAHLSRRGGRPAGLGAHATPQALSACHRPLAVASKLAWEWSPAQVAGWLKLEFPDQDTMRVSHETIYRSLFIQARGVLKKELIGHLRSRRTMQRAKHASTIGQPRGQIVDGAPSATGPLRWKIGRFPVI
jgi:hypothetical protein